MNAVAINFTGWTQGGVVVSSGLADLEGYNAHDYFASDVPSEFSSEAQALAFIDANYKGADAHGVEPAFKVF